MKKSAYLYSTLLLTILLGGCNSLDSDAKKAARLNHESIEYIKAADLQKAEELYKESRNIIASYKDTDKFEEFYTAYNSYMENSSK